MKKDTSAYCGESFAVVFYTFQKASEIRPRLISVIKEYFDIVNPVFTKYALNDGKYKNVPSNKNAVEIVEEIIEKYDFERSMCFQICNDDPDKIHNAGFELYLDDYTESMPSEIYFEFPMDSDITDIFSFMNTFCCLINIKYAFCNPIISYNILHYPASASKATQMVLDKRLYHTKNDICLNGTLEQHFKDNKIGIVNLIQFFSDDFDIDFVNDCQESDEIYFERGENYFSLSALYLDGEYDENDVEYFEDVPEDILFERYQLLREILKDVITLDYERFMFFKKEKWDTWIRRFD